MLLVSSEGLLGKVRVLLVGEGGLQDVGLGRVPEARRNTGDVAAFVRGQGPVGLGGEKDRSATQSLSLGDRVSDLLFVALDALVVRLLVALDATAAGGFAEVDVGDFGEFAGDFVDEGLGEGLAALELLLNAAVGALGLVLGDLQLVVLRVLEDDVGSDT